jgi:NTE family protein
MPGNIQLGTVPEYANKNRSTSRAAIPIYFAAVFTDSTGTVIEHPKRQGNYNVYVDGGLLDNYPIDVFKDGESPPSAVSQFTLGLKLERPEQITYGQNHDGLAPYPIHSFGNYVGALYNVIIEQLNKGIPPAEERNHTIYISTSNLNPRVRHITREQKELLFNNGTDGARKFFSMQQ